MMSEEEKEYFLGVQGVLCIEYSDLDIREEREIFLVRLMPPFPAAFLTMGSAPA
jgi:hypothetical protein